MGILGLIESLVAMPTLGDDFKEFMKQTKAVHADTALCLDLHIALSALRIWSMPFVVRIFLVFKKI